MSQRGSIKQDKVTKRWYFVIDRPGVGGKRHQIRRRGFTTKRAAEAELDRITGQMAVGIFVDPSKLTLGEYLTDHWLDAMALTVRPTTADTYRRLVRHHVVPRLGHVALQKVDRKTVTWFVGELSAAGLSPKTVRNVHGVLAKALADAMELELVARNVAVRTKGLPRAEKQKPRAWSTDELTTFLGAVERDEWAALWRVIAMTGCRRGEALGMRWPDIDLESGVITITRQRTIAGGKVVEGPTKSVAGERTVAIDAETVRALTTWRKRQAADKLRMGGIWPTGDLVFTNADGTGMWPQRVTAKFKTIVGGLKLPQIGVHGLRHTAATWMIASGINPKVVSQRVGHSHVAVTLGLYAHVLPGHDREAANALAAAVSATPVTNP